MNSSVKHFIEVVAEALPSHPRFANLLQTFAGCAERKRAAHVVATRIANDVRSPSARRKFLQTLCVGGGALAVSVSAQAAGLGSAFLGGVLQRAIELLQKIIKGANQALQFFEHTVASLYGTERTAKDRNGELNYYNADGNSPLASARFNVNEGREWGYRRSTVDAGSTSGLLYRPGTSPQDFAQMRSSEIQQLDDIDRMTNSNFVVPAGPWQPIDRSMSSSAVERKLEDAKLDARHWKVDAARLYDRSKFGLNRDTFAGLSATNVSTGERRIVV